MESQRYPNDYDGVVGAAANVQRPLCPDPRVAQYQGSGSTNDASSFVCR